MNLALRKVVLSAVFILSIIVASYLITTNRNSPVFCKYKDPILCAFLEEFERSGLYEQSGVYEETFNGRSNSIVTWSLGKSAMEIVYKNPVKEQLHYILKDDMVYLKDYEDNKWWQQSKKEADRYSNQLPFDPNILFNDINEMISNDNLNIVKVEEDICLGEECVTYEFVNKSGQPLDTRLSISKNSNSIRKVEIVGEMQREISFFKKKNPVNAPLQNIKPAPTGTNLFLSNFLERSQEIESVPEYVVELEDALKQGTASAGTVTEVEVTPEF